MINFDLNYEGFEQHLIGRQERDQNNPYHMVQYLFEFENEYGASVIKGKSTFGGSQDLWELGVLAFDFDGDFRLTEETEVASEVVGYLTDAEVRELLKRIKELPMNPMVVVDERFEAEGS